VLGSQLGEKRPPGKLLRGNPIHLVQVSERGALPILGPLAHVSLQFVTGPEIEFLNDPSTNVNVIIARGIRFLLAPYEARTSWKHVQDAKGPFVRHASVTIA
jgi:hypothetical protein